VFHYRYVCTPIVILIPNAEFLCVSHETDGNQNHDCSFAELCNMEHNCLMA
jgi:hypothetical protein